MNVRVSIAVLTLSLASAAAHAQDALGDLESKKPAVLPAAEVQKLLPGAKISRTTTAGSRQFWSNDASGKFIASSDNRSQARGRSTPGSAPGTWHIDERGRYCVMIDWRIGKEDWCRVVIRADDGYYLARSGQDKSEKVFRIEIDGK